MKSSVSKILTIMDPVPFADLPPRDSLRNYTFILHCFTFSAEAFGDSGCSVWNSLKTFLRIEIPPFLYSGKTIKGEQMSTVGEREIITKIKLLSQNKNVLQMPQ